MATGEARALPTQIGWAAGAIGSGLIANLQGTLFLFFMSRALAIPIATAGLLLLIAKLYGIVLNPLMGVLSDRTKGRLGRRRPYILAGVVIAGPAMALFLSIGASGAAATWQALAGLLAIATGYTLFNVPFLAVPGEIGLAYHERTRLMTFRHIANVMGVFLGIVVAPLLLASAATPAAGYGRVGLMAGATAIVAMLTSYVAVGRLRIEQRTPAEPARGGYRDVIGSTGFPALLMAKFAAITSPVLAQGALLFMISDVLGQSPRMLAVYGIAAIVANIVAVPFWMWLSRRLDKRRTLLLAYAGASLGHLTWLLAVPGEPALGLLARGFGIGVFTAGGLVVGYSMLPDVMAVHRHRTGKRDEGSFSGLYSMVEATAYASAPALLALLLGSQGASPGHEAIRLTLSFGPAVGYALALAAAWFYPISEKTLPGATRET